MYHHGRFTGGANGSVGDGLHHASWFIHGRPEIQKKSLGLQSLAQPLTAMMLEDVCVCLFAVWSAYGGPLLVDENELLKFPASIGIGGNGSWLISNYR